MRATDIRGRSIRKLLLKLMLAAALAAGALVAVAPHEGSAAKREYIANDDHTDYWWAGSDTDYRFVFQDMLNYYMTQAESTAYRSHDQRGRFNCDCSLWVWEWEHARSTADMNRLVSHLRDSTLSMPLNTAVMCYGGMPAEAVLRNMYYAGRLERRYSLRFPLVAAMENQTLPSGGLGSLWAGAGAKYSWRGICGCATRLVTGERAREIYNYTGADGQGVTLRWNSCFGSGSVGGYAEARQPTNVVSLMTGDPIYQMEWPWDVTAAFGYGSDDLETKVDSFLNASQVLANASRRVIVSNEADFFQDFMASHGTEIPTFSGSYGNEWDLYCASMGEVTAAFRREVEKLRTAEALASIVSLQDPTFKAGPDSIRDKAFKACGLYFEHDWTADGAFPRSVRAQFQRNMLTDLSTWVDSLYSKSLAALASKVSLPTNGGERHMVFNPLSWVRTDYVDLAVSQAPPLHVMDVTTNTEVPSQQVTVGGRAYTRILASKVPELGYRTYQVLPGAGQVFPAAATVTLPAADNGIYKVTMGPQGDLTSIVDHKDTERELVDNTAGGSLFGLGTGGGTVYVENTGPVSTTLRVLSGGSPTHESRVTLYAGLDRIDFEGRVTQNFGTNLSYYSTFNLPGASIRHEELGNVLRVARVSQGGGYSDTDCRTDWLTLNHFADLSTASRGITLSTGDSPFMQTGQSTYNTLDTLPTLRTVIGMQVDGASLGIPNEGGDTLFTRRYALRSHYAYDQAAAMRFALEHQNPLVEARLTGIPVAPLPATNWELVSISSSDILLWALKPAEEGISQGLIARVWNLADAPRTLSLTLPPYGINSARSVTHIETDLGAAVVTGSALQDALARQQMRTYRLTPGTVATGVGAGPAEAPLLRVGPSPLGPRGQATVAFVLPSPGVAKLTVHDVSGRRVATLADGALAAGERDLRWDGRDASGARVASGVYFVRLSVGGSVRTARLVVLH